MPFIENIAASDVPRGLHKDPGPNSMLISITDPGGRKPDAKHVFKERHNFEFLDVEKDTEVDDEEMRCSPAQAAELAALLTRALAEGMNVIVHCYAGICRSGAVAEVGCIMGFDDTHTYRQPNLLVKHGMMRALGLYYDEDETTSDEYSWTHAKIGWER
jgi:predicted protein tyrosine phosphatase